MKTKILYIITQSSWGGAQKYVFDLATNLPEDFQVTVLCGGNGELISRLKAKEVKVKVMKNLIRPIRPFTDAICLWQLRSFIKKEKFDIVHTNSSKAEILGNISAWLAGTKKTIFTAHGFVFNEPGSKFKKKIFINLEKFANKFADRIICVSDFDKKNALKHGISSEKKLTVIHNGIKVANDLLGNEKIKIKKNYLKLPEDSVVVVAIANFYETKGLKYLIDASSKIIKKHPNVYFVLVGDGELREDLKARIKANKIENNFIMPGFRNDIPELLQIMDIFVLSSLKEGFPYVIMEAMSFGLPVVATEVGGVPEIVNQETGLICRPGEANELADCIEKLIDNPLLGSELGENAKRFVNEKFCFKKMLQKTINIYYS